MVCVLNIHLIVASNTCTVVQGPSKETLSMTSWTALMNSLRFPITCNNMVTSQDSHHVVIFTTTKICKLHASIIMYSSFTLTKFNTYIYNVHNIISFSLWRCECVGSIPTQVLRFFSMKESSDLYTIAIYCL